LFASHRFVIHSNGLVNISRLDLPAPTRKSNHHLSKTFHIYFPEQTQKLSFFTESFQIGMDTKSQLPTMAVW